VRIFTLMGSSMRHHAAPRVHYQEILAFGREFGERQGVAESLEEFGCVMFASGRLGQAARLWGEAVRPGR
jgi:hypothetical protein